MVKVKSGESVVRTITVRKMRQCNHLLETVPFEIGKNGILVYAKDRVFV
jgi:KaiC/GvpD/RAD55 family RecA-like ATPase